MPNEIRFKQPRLSKEGKFIDWFYWGFIDGGFISPIRLDLPSYQYIGKQDKYNQDIYDGNILEFIGEEDDEPFYETVFWDNEMLCWALRANSYIEPFNDMVDESPKIVSHIYENPELKGE